MPRAPICMLVLFFSVSSAVSGQADSSEYKIYAGIVLDDSLSQGLSFVHIWNESTRAGTTSDARGNFEIGVKGLDTLVFTAIGYASSVVHVPSKPDEINEIRLSPRSYEIGELVVRRFISYESFIYQATHLDLPEPLAAEQKAYLRDRSTIAALEADHERVVRQKVESGGFGFITPLGPGVDRAKIFRDKMDRQEARQKVIQAKFNRQLVGDLTGLEGDELTDFLAMCNFSEQFLYESDLYTIADTLYARYEAYRKLKGIEPE